MEPSLKDCRKSVSKKLWKACFYKRVDVAVFVAAINDKSILATKISRFNFWKIINTSRMSVSKIKIEKHALIKELVLPRAIYYIIFTVYNLCSVEGH